MDTPHPNPTTLTNISDLGIMHSECCDVNAGFYVHPADDSTFCLECPLSNGRECLLCHYNTASNEVVCDKLAPFSP